jgi:ABC-type sulfate/molybdate transport systems ATPase subunit
MISMRHLSKSFGGKQVLCDLSLDVKTSEILCLVGPSGVGKSTTLNIVAGLLEPEKGEIEINRQIVDRRNLPGKRIHTHPAERSLGYVMQDNGLFHHMTVRQNIAFGLESKHVNPEAVDKRIDELLFLLRIGEVADHYPCQLSGGQKKRVSLARSLAPEPKILLLDEPLSSLDEELKEHLKFELKDLIRRLGLTVIYVTHDSNEARFLADRIAIVEGGIISRILESGKMSLLAQTMSPDSLLISEFKTAKVGVDVAPNQ